MIDLKATAQEVHDVQKEQEIGLIEAHNIVLKRKRQDAIE